MECLPKELVLKIRPPLDPVTHARLRLTCRWYAQCLRLPVMGVPRWLAETHFGWERAARRHDALLAILRQLSLVGSPKRAPDEVTFSKKGGMIRLVWRFLPDIVFIGRRTVIQSDPNRRLAYIENWERHTRILVLYFRRHQLGVGGWHRCQYEPCRKCIVPGRKKGQRAIFYGYEYATQSDKLTDTEKWMLSCIL
jgi:hypothetical protein